jgi:hypothetical protein
MKAHRKQESFVPPGLGFPFFVKDLSGESRNDGRFAGISLVSTKQKTKFRFKTFREKKNGNFDSNHGEIKRNVVTEYKTGINYVSNNFTKQKKRVGMLLRIISKQLNKISYCRNRKQANIDSKHFAKIAPPALYIQEILDVFKKYIFYNNVHLSQKM